MSSLSQEMAGETSNPADEYSIRWIRSADADVVKSVGRTIPADPLRRFGFVRNSAPAFDDQTKPPTVAARPLGEERTGPEVEAVTDRSNWLPTLLEPDKD